MGSTSQDGVSTAEGIPPAQPAQLLQDDQIFGGYRIIRLLGRGGMGEVYEADDLVSGRRVALKVVNVARSSPIALQRFLREGQLAASLSHPNTVYVFESGETDGIPYIVTELVSGGTLADRVKASGPVPVSQAVDAILDVIAGLEAAADLGILHRDVKPSNCFVLDEGGVKIGDFGVSIPLDANERTELTLTGVIVGTPSYCAPEQLKGEELDVRSDIYSVGATLFYLLVGHPPFRATDIVRLIEQVLVATPDPPLRRRPDVPKRLSEVVAACLSKKREHRPATYEALAAALKPFSSASLAPAALAPRALAAALDALFLVVMWNLTNALIVVPLAAADLSVAPMRFAVRATVAVLYFALQEYWVGGSLGKLLCGLGVANAHGSRIGLWPAAVRASIVFGALSVPTPLAVGPLGRYVWMSPGPLGVVAALLLFITARRSNGYSGIHELLTGSRTWEAPSPRHVHTDIATLPVQATQASSESIGPYRVAQRFDQDSTLVLARDERLKRPVWLRLASANEASVSPARRDLDRPLRFRWLGGRRSAGDSWDCYEHVEGCPLVNLGADQLPFQTVARWLAAIASECRVAGADGTLPVVGLNQLWVTRSGGLRVADWPLPDVDAGGESYATGDVGRCQQFLARVAATALGRSTHRAPSPVYGSSLLNAINRGSFADFDDLVAACERAAARDSTLSMERRVAPLITASVFVAIPFIAVASQMAQLSLFQLRITQRTQMFVCLAQLTSLNRGYIDDESGARRQAAEMCVAAASRDLGATMLNQVREQYPDSALIVESARRKYPQVSIADLQARFDDMPPAFDIRQLQPETAAQMRANMVKTTTLTAVVFSIGLLGALGVVSIVVALLLKEGPLYRMLGIAIVRADGSRVSRARALARSTVTWLLALAAAAIIPPLYSVVTWRVVMASVAVAGMAMAAVYAARHPTRGLPERLTGTFLVRR